MSAFDPFPTLASVCFQPNSDINAAAGIGLLERRGVMASVFLSYGREDVDTARPVAQALERAGHAVFWDVHIRGGAQFSKVIEEALRTADAVVVLWSKHSVASAWVLDEAAAGRDTARLVPVTIDATEPPLGFRQFQTIDLGRYRGRGKKALQPLLAAIDETNGQAAEGSVSSSQAHHSKTSTPLLRGSLLAFAGVLVLGLGASVWPWMARNATAVVEVTAADSSPRSQNAAHDLFVKLGTLAHIGKGKWQLVDASAVRSEPDLAFRTADTGSSGEARANLILLDGKNDGLLWSREFSFPAGSEADLRLQLGLTAGRVLQCALESRDAGGLRPDLLKQFLKACSILAETSYNEPGKGLEILRATVASAPTFMPAWRRLIVADLDVLAFHRFGGDPSKAMHVLRSDMAKARKIDPSLPELALAERSLLPPTAYQKRFQLVESAGSRTPDSTMIASEEAAALQSVGRMSDAAAAARRAAELDPLSPVATMELIMTLAYAGQTEEARQELNKAERLWAGTNALRNALFAFHLRYGDPETARRNSPGRERAVDLYLDARAQPSSSAVKKLLAYIREHEKHPGMYGAVQDLGEFNQIDQALRLIAQTPTERVASESYQLFRPGLAGLRRDRRFMQVAHRIGLVDFWRSTGKWPDYCNDPELPYSCKQEGAKLTATNT